MDTFSISQLQQFSGIKAHTIRIWEQRYNALKPLRSQGNTRYYDNNQLRRLLNIVSLLKLEYKISDICLLPDEKMFKIIEGQLNSNSLNNDTTDYFINQLISSAVLYNEKNFEKVFAAAVFQHGLKKTYTKIIYPMLWRVGLMWSNDSIPPAQEHFISNVIRQKLLSATDALPLINSSKDCWLLFLPENEMHEIGLLFSQYIIRCAGKRVIYLGSNVPLESLINTLKTIETSNVFFFLVHNNIPENSQTYINSLIKNIKKSKIFISGNEELLGQLNFHNKISWLHSVEELEHELVES